MTLYDYIMTYNNIMTLPYSSKNAAMRIRTFFSRPSQTSHYPCCGMSQLRTLKGLSIPQRQVSGSLRLNIFTCRIPIYLLWCNRLK